MAQTKYTYSIATDTANAKLAADALKQEIADSAIVIALDYIAAMGDVLDIYMKDVLTTGDKTLLDGVVAAHQGVPLPENAVQSVELNSKTALGTPVVAIKKPDGTSKTYISHNFCDNTTWPATNDSKWSVAPPSGKIFKVLKAEVQFSHDIQFATATPGREMNLNVMAGGSPADTKVFKSLADVFDLGNKHYSMNATVDGIPGMTTVTFDYADAIVLRNAYAMSMDFDMKDHLEMGGSHCSVSLVIEEVDE